MPLTRTRPQHPTVSVVVPARNEADNLREVLPSLAPFHEVVVVDGHSADDSKLAVAESLPTARFIQQTRRGKGNALACGIAAATGDIVVLFDADGSADPQEIDRFVAALARADVAKGSRAMVGGGSEDLTWLRSAGNRFLTVTTNLLFKTRYTDLCYGYNALWRDLVPALGLPSVEPIGGDVVWGDGFEIEAVLHCRVAAAGLDVAEVPSVELRRIHGSSNLSVVRDGLRVLRTITAEWRTQRRRAALTPVTAVSGSGVAAVSADKVTANAGAHAGPAATQRRLAPRTGTPQQTTGPLPVQHHRDDREVLLDAAG